MIAEESKDIADEKKAKDLGEDKRGRIIIRNLVYDIHEKQLRSLFGKFGEINSVYSGLTL